jgi:CcmD family protein
MNRFKNFLFVLLFLPGGQLFCQEAHQPVMADAFYKEGKVYVVVVVLAIVLLGMIVYLFSMDRKLKKLEEELKNKK